MFSLLSKTIGRQEYVHSMVEDRHLMLSEFQDAIESFRSTMVELENSMYEKDAQQLEEVKKSSIHLHICLKVQ